MRLVSFNIRGFGGRPKTLALRKLLDELIPDMVFFQETMCSREQALFSFTQLRPGWEFCACDTIRLSGGLLSTWNPLIVRCKAYITFEGILVKA